MAKIVVDGITVGVEIPIGGIMMYSGDILTIPVEWALCDGNNGTPNLVGQFIKGATTAGGVGGSADAQVISHTHTNTASATASSTSSVTDAGHIHGVTDSGHSHHKTLSNRGNIVGDTGTYWKSGTVDTDGTIESDTDPATTGITIDSSPSWLTVATTTTVTPTVTIDASGVAGAGLNQPQFYELMYIMRIS